MKLIIAFLLLSFSIFGQDTTRHKATIMLNGSFSNINGQSQTSALVNNSYSITRKNLENQILLKYLYASENGAVVINDFTIRVQPRYLKKSWSAFAYHQFSSLLSRRIETRYELALGTGRYLIKYSNFYSTLSYASIYVDTKYTTGLNITSIRHSLRAQFGGNIKHVTYTAEGFYQPAFDDILNYNYSYDIKVSVPIVKRLSFNMNSYGNFETFNLKGVSSTNDILSLGLTYNY